MQSSLVIQQRSACLICDGIKIPPSSYIELRLQLSLQSACVLQRGSRLCPALIVLQSKLWKVNNLKTCLSTARFAVLYAVLLCGRLPSVALAAP